LFYGYSQAAWRKVQSLRHAPAAAALAEYAASVAVEACCVPAVSRRLFKMREMAPRWRFRRR